MSQAEVWDIVSDMHALSMGAMMFYLSIVTAYLVAAKFVGSELETSQVVIITGLFLVFSAFAVWGSIAYFRVGTYFVLQTEAYLELQTQSFVDPEYVIGLAEVLGILASLKFMRDIRFRAASSKSADVNSNEPVA